MTTNVQPPKVILNNGYNEDQIKVLEGLEAVRKRPGMYIGGTGLTALHHLVYEVLDNSIDEAMAGFATTIDITILADGSCAVVDDGRGIPVGPMKHEDPALDGKPAVEIVMTKLHAGGKFGEEGSAYKVSGGLHGVGVSCVNALSEYLDCEVYREGKVHAIGFERGRTTRPLHRVGDSADPGRTGTKIVFKPDPEIFPDTDFHYETLLARTRELAYLNPGVTIRLNDERVGPDGQLRSDSFRAEKGLVEYVAHLMTGKTPVCSAVHLLKRDGDLVCEVAFQYHDGYNETLLTFANNINNVDGGTHAQGFKVALTRTLNAYARKAGIIKEKDPVPTGEDLREGLIAIVSVKLPNPAFNNQPKEKLLNPEVEGYVAACVNEALDAWLEEHPAEAKRLALKGVIAAQAREAARKARELTRRKTALDSGSMPHKLRDCRLKGEGSELFIVEGDSAGGSATQGRDVDTQAILPLRGKLLNVEKARLDKVLAFEEIRTLIAALRCGIGEEFDISRLNYGKVVIMTDADVDGSHIRTLLLTFFFRQMPELVRRGKIYIAQPPLYQLVRGKKSRYVLNQKELSDVLIDLGLDGALLRMRDLLRPGAPVVHELAGDALRRCIHILRRFAELVEIAERRGVRFPALLAARRDGRLPTHRVSTGSNEVFAWSEAEAHAVAGSAPDAIVRELHENRELERIFADLETLGLSADDYSLAATETLGGEALPTRYEWTTAEHAGAAEPDGAIRVPSLPGILASLIELGRRGMEVKRFKGLGEMDAEQLWETTMDPSKRTLLRVTWDMASDADGLFTILMGEQVEPRRKFIEDHALEVKNLDV